MIVASKRHIHALFSNIMASLHPYSSVLFVSDNANWVLDWEIKEVSTIAQESGVPCRISGSIPCGLPLQSLFLSSKYWLSRPGRYLYGKSRIAFPYFHGDPASGEEVAVACYNNLKRVHGKIDRIQVSNRRMRDIVLDSGVSPAKVFLIPIGVNPIYFKRQTQESRKTYRFKYGIPQESVVIGSFQKDGNGWGEGATPKLIKGPDIFLKTIEILKNSVPELFVLLSGPARGYVKQGLDRLKVPFTHIYLEHYPAINELYQCLDAYIVASREEGGPKAILESMACGVPVISTQVGQAVDLIYHGKNGWLANLEDAEGLAHWTMKALASDEEKTALLEDGLMTARENAYQAQRPLWEGFFKGFVRV